MKLYEKEILIPLKEGHRGLLRYFAEYILYQSTNEIPVRFVVTKTDEKGYHCELGVLSDINIDISEPKSIFDFKKRVYEKNDKFNAVLVIPTGIDAVLGGHAGDAGALARYMAETCDTLITHPNVVNASDINELPENGLYVEGSVLSRLMMGTIGLQKVRANRLEVIINEHEEKYFTTAAINSVSAARASLGLSAKVVKLKDKFKMKSRYSKSGRATGIVEDLERLYGELGLIKNEYDALAISSIIEVDPEICNRYYSEEIVNPWGGVEAILTHAVSLLLDIPSAHSPMGYSKETEFVNLDVVDPRKAAEVVSTTYLYCVLKGLYKSPKIITDSKIINHPGIINASDINCLVLPDRCIGLPTLAALEQGIHVIAVKENKNLMKNDLTQLPWAENQLNIVENYLDAVGIIYALKSGISPYSVRRPLNNTRIVETKKFIN